MKTVTLFSDGSCLGNPGFGGWAFILNYKSHELKKSGATSDTTNNKMELTAVIEALKMLKEPCAVELYTDSSYVANAINSWLYSWVKKEFKDVKNVPLWREYLNLASPHKVSAHWVKAHNGHLQNEECDTMAREAALNLKSQKER